MPENLGWERRQVSCRGFDESSSDLGVHSSIVITRNPLLGQWGLMQRSVGASGCRGLGVWGIQD